ncbi:MAG: DNA-processing protein DprA [Candidatus Saccharibacteria bacterium]|nr:DNA-processing protein DprA [Candidatus Saccharibacteria bacterium]
MKGKVVTLTGNDIPRKLREIPSPPKRLYAKGEILQAESIPLLAVVGSRKVSGYGRDVTSRLIREVADKGVGIVSGLALGVDGLAHEAALEANAYTVAIMPAGLDEIYPKSHFHIGKRILKSGGALISEYPEGKPPLLPHFTERNRLVSGLSDAVLITEAAAKSGTMHTANFALDQGKTVMAIPGNITSHTSQGTNNLIKAGAVPVTEAEDILTALGMDSTQRQTELFGDTPEETTLLKLIADSIHDTHQLQKASELDATQFNQTLTMLEINGKIRNQGGGQWTLS